MQINSNNYPLLGCWKQPIKLEQFKWFDTQLAKYGLFAESYNDFANEIKPKCLANVEYITENVRKAFEDDAAIGNKMWELRDEVPSKYGLLLLKDRTHYLYFINNDTKNEEVAFSVFIFHKGIFVGNVAGLWRYNSFPDIYLSDKSFHAAHGFNGYHKAYSVQMVVVYNIFKEYAAPEVVVVNCKKKQKINFNEETYLNKEFPFNINIVDSHYFKTIIRDEGFGVKGHFRLQPCGEGRNKKKLIYINEFQKHGYKRIAKIDRIKNNNS